MTEVRKKRLSVGERATIVARLLEGERASHLAVEYGVSQAAISKMKKNKENILANKRHLEEQQSSISKRKCTGTESSAMERGLYKWYVQMRSLGHGVSASMLQQKAVLFNAMITGSSDFKASNGWLNKFKIRHSISEFIEQPGLSLFDECSSKDFAAKFAHIVRVSGINPDHIYNADETSLVWKMVPNKTIVTELERETNGWKIQDDRVTIMVCSNASGTHKIPVLVIGKSQETEKSNDTVPSVIYKSETNAWMNQILFTKWYTEIFIPALKEKHGSKARCVLWIDNAPSHPRVEVLNTITTICTVNNLPPNVTCFIQPSHDVGRHLKSTYKENLLRNMISQKELREIVKYLKSLDIVNCCNALARAWESVTEINIKNAWKHILQIPEIPLYDRQFLEPYTLFQLLKQLPNGDEMTTEETRKWFHDEQDDSGWKVLSDEEILLLETDNEQTDEPEINPVELSDEDDCPTLPEEALQGIEVFERWYQKRSECSPEHLILLKKFRDLAAREVLSKKLNLGLPTKQ